MIDIPGEIGQSSDLINQIHIACLIFAT